jgi:hypothetical protein
MLPSMTQSSDSHHWPVIDPADVDVFMNGPPIHLEKVLRLMTVKRNIVNALELIMEDVGKGDWYSREPAIVHRVSSLMSESNEILDYFRDKAPHLRIKWPRMEPFNFGQFVVSV